jgi:hypothetical protein
MIARASKGQRHRMDDPELDSGLSREMKGTRPMDNSNLNCFQSPQMQRHLLLRLNNRKRAPFLPLAQGDCMTTRALLHPCCGLVGSSKSAPLWPKRMLQSPERRAGRQVVESSMVGQQRRMQNHGVYAVCCVSPIRCTGDWLSASVRILSGFFVQFEVQREGRSV